MSRNTNSGTLEVSRNTNSGTLEVSRNTSVLNPVSRNTNSGTLVVSRNTSVLNPVYENTNSGTLEMSRNTSVLNPAPRIRSTLASRNSDILNPASGISSTLASRNSDILNPASRIRSTLEVSRNSDILNPGSGIRSTLEASKKSDQGSLHGTPSQSKLRAPSSQTLFGALPAQQTPKLTRTVRQPSSMDAKSQSLCLLPGDQASVTQSGRQSSVDQRSVSNRGQMSQRRSERTSQSAIPRPLGQLPRGGQQTPFGQPSGAQPANVLPMHLSEQPHADPGLLGERKNHEQTYGISRTSTTQDRERSGLETLRSATIRTLSRQCSATNLYENSEEEVGSKNKESSWESEGNAQKSGYFSRRNSPSFEAEKESVSRKNDLVDLKSSGYASRKNSSSEDHGRKNSGRDVKSELGSGYTSRKNSQSEEVDRKSSEWDVKSALGKRSESRKSTSGYEVKSEHGSRKNSGYEVKSDQGSRKNSQEWNFPSVNYNYYHSRLNVLNAEGADKYKSRRNSYDLIRDRCLAILNMDGGKRRGRSRDEEAYQVSKIITVFDNVGKKQGKVSGKSNVGQGKVSGKSNVGQGKVSGKSNVGQGGKNGDRRGKERKERENEKLKSEGRERKDVEERFIRNMEEMIGIIESPKTLRKKPTGDGDKEVEGVKEENSFGGDRKEKDSMEVDKAIVGNVRSEVKEEEKHITNVRGESGGYVKELENVREKKSEDKLMKMEKVIENVKIQHAQLMEEMKRKVNEQGSEEVGSVERNSGESQSSDKGSSTENNESTRNDREDIIKEKEKLKMKYSMEKNIIKTQATIEHQNIRDVDESVKGDKKRTNVHQRNSSIAQSFVDFKPSVPSSEKIIKIFDSSYFVITKERNPTNAEIGKDNRPVDVENIRKQGSNRVESVEQKAEDKRGKNEQHIEKAKTPDETISKNTERLDKDREYESMAHEILKSIDNMGSGDTATNGKYSLLYERIEEEVDIESKDGQNVQLQVDKSEVNRTRLDRSSHSFNCSGDANKNGIGTRREQFLGDDLGSAKTLPTAVEKLHHDTKALTTESIVSQDNRLVRTLGDFSTNQSSNETSAIAKSEQQQEQKLSQYEQILQQNQKLIQQLHQQQLEKQPKELTVPQQQQQQQHKQKQQDSKQTLPQESKRQQPKTKTSQQQTQDRSQQTQFSAAKGVRTSASTVTKLSKSSIQEDMLEIWLDHQKFLQRHPEDDSFYSFLFVFFAVFASFVFVLIVYFVMFVV